MYADLGYSCPGLFYRTVLDSYTVVVQWYVFTIQCSLHMCCWWGQAYRLTILYPNHYLNNLFLTISLCKNHLFSLDQVPYQVKTLKDNTQ